MPPPRAHRHRYCGVLAPNAPLRAAVTALALAPVIVPEPKPADAIEADEPRPRAVSHYLWAMFLARIYEAFPLTCPFCNAPMRIIAFINDADSVGQILNHIGESTLPPKIAPARGPPLWASMADFGQAENDPQWDSSAQPEPEFEFDQHVAW